MKESKRWQDILISAGIFAAATFIIAGLCGLVCALFMKPLGFRYESLWDIVVFFFWGSLVAIPISLVAAALPKALYALGKLPRWGARLLDLALDSFATALGLAVVGGLCFSQLVTLYITPVYYAYMEDFSRWLTRRFGQRFEANRAARAEHEKEEGSHAG